MTTFKCSDTQDRTAYEIAEIVELQKLRDAALQEVRV
jgi:hypothetical protein